MAPILIIGTERSGSNLLRLILDAHPRLFVPHPPHVVKYFSGFVERYGDLSEEARFRALVRDVLRLVEGHIYPWPQVPELERVLALAPERSLVGAYAGLYEAAREISGKPRWGCKSTFMVAHGEEVLRVLPEARFIWLFRDPRDVASSSRRSVFSTFHPWYTGQLWATQQEQARALEAARPDRVLRLRYEDLVKDPPGQVARICAFIGEELHPAMLAWHEGEEARRSASLSESWSNTNRPAQQEGVGKWRKELTEEEIRLVEAAAGPTMEALGYPLSGLPPIEPGAAARLRYWASDKGDWLKVEARSLQRDKNVGRRWRRALLLADLKARAGRR